MEQEKTAEELEAEKQAQAQDDIPDENDTHKNDDTQAVEDDKDVGDDEKQEESPFKKQLEELNDELSKKNDIIDKKERALQAEKRKNKEFKREEIVEEKKEDVQFDEDAFEARMTAKWELKQMLKEHTQDAVERELIQKIYDNRIIKTGDVDKDFRAAVAIANQNVVFDYKNGQLQREKEEDEVLESMSFDAPSKNRSKLQDPVKKLAASILRNAGKPDAIKNLK